MIGYRLLEGILFEDARTDLGRYLANEFKVEIFENEVRRRTVVYLTGIENLAKLEKCINDYYRAVNNEPDLECELLINMSSNILTILVKGYYEIIQRRKKLNRGNSDYQRINRKE